MRGWISFLAADLREQVRDAVGLLLHAARYSLLAGVILSGMAACTLVDIFIAVVWLTGWRQGGGHVAG